MENKPRRRAQQPPPEIPAGPEPTAKRRRAQPTAQPPAQGGEGTGPQAPQASQTPQASQAPKPTKAPRPEQAPQPPPAKKKKKKKKRNKTRLLIFIIVVLLLLIVLLGVLVYQVNRKREFEQYVFDTEAIEGRIQTMTEAEILEELNRVVEEGMFNISIASAIIFDAKTEQGQARIENIAANHYHMQVDIFLDSTQELVYSSNLLRPGYSLEYIKLNRKLEPGEYEATAVFSAITQEEMQLFGQAAAQIKLFIMDENGEIPAPTPTPTAEATVQPSPAQ